VTDLDAFLYACGREDGAQTWTSEREERASLQVWETLGETDLVASCRGRLSLLDDTGSLPGGPLCAGAAHVDSGAEQVTRTALDTFLESEVPE
jgi:hypothetical protein